MINLPNYERWSNYANLDSKLRDEMNHMNEKDLYESFYTNMEFGTAGIRGILGPGTNKMNIYTVRKASEAFARYILENIKNPLERGIVVAHDNRMMSREFCLESAKVFAAHGIKTYIFDSLRPTPELSYAVRELKAAGGVVITASHNPKEYNGYKVYDEEGCQLVPHLIDKLLVHYNAIEDELAIEVDEEKAKVLTEVLPTSLDEKYYADVKKICLDNATNQKDLKVVYSPQHGTGYQGVKAIATSLGYDLVLVKEQCEPDVNFSNTISPNPEEKTAYVKAIELLKEVNGDLIITTDPDADRLGVVTIDDGEPTYFTGNQTGAMLIEYVINKHKENGTFKDNFKVFNTIVTSPLGAAIAKKNGVAVGSTLTGFKFIGEQIALLLEEKKYEYLFGYEESYGYLLSSICRDKDALQATTIILEMALYYKNKGMTLKQVLNRIYDEYGYHYDKVESLSLKGSDGLAKIQEIMKTLRAKDIPSLAGNKVATKEDYLKQVSVTDGVETPITLPKSNVLRFVFEDGSFVAIRPSGTEPKCKFYYNIKGKDEVGRAESYRKHRNTGKNSFLSSYLRRNDTYGNIGNNSRPLRYEKRYVVRNLENLGCINRIL